MTSRRIDQIPASKGVTTADQIAVWQDGRTRVGTIGDLIEGPIYDVIEGITGINPGDPLGNASLKKNANLSDLLSVPQARTNLGLKSGALLVAGVTGGLALYDDPRFSQIGSGSPSSVTAAQITDATAFGRSLLTGSQASVQAALGLGTAAYRAVGVSGGVAAYDDPRFGTGGGGGAPSTVTASQISDATASGRSILTGSVPQALSTLGLSTATTTATLAGLSSSYANIAVHADPAPNWETLRTHNDSLLVSLNGAPGEIWPGGGDYGCTSAITGVVVVPPQAGNNNAGTVNNGVPVSGLIINAGIMGLALNTAINTVAVGVYGSSGITLNNSSGWAANFTLGNFRNRGMTPSEGFNGNLIVNEMDLNLKTPVGGWAGTNAYGSSTVLVADSQPDGGLICHHMAAVGTVGWKIGIGSDHGACDEVMRVGMSKFETVPGAKPSQQIRFISANSGQGSSSDFRHSFLQTVQNGDFLFQPNYFGTPGKIVVANAQLSQSCSLDPASGFSGSGVSVNVVNTNSIVCNNNITAGSINVGPASCGSMSVTNSLSAGSINANGGTFNNLIASSDFNFKGQSVQLSVGSPQATPQQNNFTGFKVLMVPA